MNAQPHIARLIGVVLVRAVLAATPASAQTSVPQTTPAIVSGIVRNGVTGRPVRLAVIRPTTSSGSTLSDDAGRYRLSLPLGDQQLEVRRIGFRPAIVTVVVQSGGTQADVTLDPIAVGLERVVITERDDAARRIISAAIRRKQQTRGLVHDYRYDGDTRMVIRNLSKPPDSASSIVLITQTRTSAYWERPNRYQETIVSRRQTGNLAAEQNLVGVGQIADFSRDRLQFGRFELASPVADDALERYDYRVLDTLSIDGRRIFRLSLEPKPDGAPAFAGIIDIADSTFDVTGIDVGVNNSVRLGLVRNVRYQQRFAEMSGRWMPRSIELSVDLLLPIGSTRYRLEQVAELSGFRFDEGQRPAGLKEYRIVVADGADRTDSAAWHDARAIPLTPLEQRAWTRIDSIAHSPLTFRRRLVRGGFALAALASNPDFFHFNRVDGAYGGAARTWLNSNMVPTTETTLKLGYADASDRWQYRAGERIRLSESRRVWVGASYHDETMSRPTLTSPGYNPTLRALFSTIDPLDYYRERGLVASLTTKLVDFVRLDAEYTDARQLSLPLAVSKPALRRAQGRLMRPNEPIDDGYLRSLSAAITYDTRSLVRQGDTDLRISALEWTRLSVQAELAPGRALASDFNYRRYSVRVDRRQPTFGFGVTRVLATGGVGSSGMPAQRFFGVDGGAQVLEAQASPFSTLVDSSFSAPRAAVLSVEHDFDRLLFTKSQLPFIRDIPFTLTVRGSMFWTEDAVPFPGRLVIGAPYREAGFSIGNITPYLAPFNLSARFAWQISDYPTTPFRFSIGFAP